MIVKGRLAGLIVAACLQASPIHAGTETQAWVTPQRPLADERVVERAIRGTAKRTPRSRGCGSRPNGKSTPRPSSTQDGRVVDNANGNVSHSEGQGYGLLLAALAGDSDRFDKIWRWTETHMMVRPDHLLSWRWDPQKGAITDTNNATDGDILVAWALAQGRAKVQPSRLSRLGRGHRRRDRRELIKNSDHGLILLPAAQGFGHDDQPDGPVVNLSYWVFPAFSTLKDLAPAYDWEALHANGLKLLNVGRFGPLRLPPDWLSLGGQTPAPAQKFPSQFGYNAIRIPLYLAWDSAPQARHALSGFVNLWRGPRSAGPYVIDVNSGSAEQILDGAGYRLALALARCVSLDSPIDEQVIKSRDPLYYPDTLRMLSLAAI